MRQRIFLARCLRTLANLFGYRDGGRCLVFEQCINPLLPFVVMPETWFRPQLNDHFVAH